MTVGNPMCPYRTFVGIFIPEALLDYRGINAAEKLCLGRLYRYCGRNAYCYPSQEKLSEDLGVDIRTVSRYIHNLVEDGFISVKQQGLGLPNVYKMLWHKVFESDTSDLSEAEMPQLLTEASNDTSGLSRQHTANVSDPSILYRVIYKENIDRPGNDKTNTLSEKEKTEELATEQEFRQAWSRTKGLPHLGAGARTKLCGSYKPELTVDQLTLALGNFYLRTKNRKITDPLAYFLKNQLSWIKNDADDGSDDPLYIKFKQNYESVNGGVIPSDWRKVPGLFSCLSKEEKEKAVLHILTSNPDFVKNPFNYINDKEFNRPPRLERKSKRSKIEEMIDSL